MQGIGKVDALVVGARCAGAATAMLMARGGMKVLAIDRDAYGTDTLSTHALMRGGVLLLHRWGLLGRLREMGTPPVPSTSFHYGDEVVEVAIRAADGVDALYAPRRTVLDSLLVDAAVEAGARVRHGHMLVDLVRRADGRVAGAVLRDAEGRLVEIAADLVVGADGINSTVARLAEAPLQRVARHASAVVYGYVAGLATTGYGWHYRPGASVGVIPTNAGQHCVFASMPPARYRDEVRHDIGAGFHRLLRGVSPELAETVVGARPQEERLRVFAGRKGFLRQPHGPGWALAGDAGYFKDPITAHGMTDALRDAVLLAAAATAGSDRAWATYASLRDILSLPLFEATDAVAAFDWDLDRLRDLHRALHQAMKAEIDHLTARAPQEEYAA